MTYLAIPLAYATGVLAWYAWKDNRVAIPIGMFMGYMIGQMLTS